MFMQAKVAEGQTCSVRCAPALTWIESSLGATCSAQKLVGVAKQKLQQFNEV